MAAERGEKPETQWKPRTPDYELKVRLKDSKVSSRVGSAWLNEDGSISVQLNVCAVLSWRDNIFISLFPFKNEKADGS